MPSSTGYETPFTGLRAQHVDTSSGSPVTGSAQGLSTSGSAPRLTGRPRPQAERLLRLEQHEVLDHERIHLRLHEGIVGLLRRQDDGLPGQIEAGVDQDRTPSLAMKLLQQAIVTAVSLVDGLHARAVVDVRDRRHAAAHEADTSRQIRIVAKRTLLGSDRGRGVPRLTGATSSM